MAQYKVPQDVEADDKLLGPFTFKQFIYIVVAVLSLLLTVFLWGVSPFLIIVSLPPLIIFGILGFYKRQDQPIETYLLAMVKFFIKPRKRLWHQDGYRRRVVVSAPKTVIKQYTDSLSKEQVQTSLKVLSQVMDTRGWALKNVSLQEGSTAMAIAQSDRLIMPGQVIEDAVDVHQSDDILDTTSTLANDLSQRSQMASSQIRQRAISQMQQHAQTPARPEPSRPAAPSQPSQNINPGDEVDLGHQPEATPQQAGEETAPPPENTPVTTPYSADILRLSQNNDLSVGAIARQADEELKDNQTIELHPDDSGRA